MAKVLLLVPRMNIGGSETYTYTLALELKKLGHEVYVASAGGKLADYLKEQGVKNFFVPVRLSKGISVWLLKRIVKKYGIDIVHANSAAAGIVAVGLKREIGIPVVYTVHGIFGNVKKEIVIDEVDKIICVSKFIEKDSAGRGFTKEKLVTCYSGVDLEKYQEDDALRKSLRKEMGISEDTLVLSLTSRIKNLHNKGHEDMLDLFEHYASKENWKLIVIGKGNGLMSLESAIKKKGLFDKILCLGHRTDVNRIINAADVIVLPSMFETFGLVLAEGMAMAKPAVAYAVGGIPEVIDDGETGFLVEYKDVANLYKKIKLLDENRQLLQEMGQKSKAKVVNEFDSRNMGKEVEAIYQEVLAK